MCIKNGCTPTHTYNWGKAQTLVGFGAFYPFPQYLGKFNFLLLFRAPAGWIPAGLKN